jgi:feruloyl esterase
MIHQAVLDACDALDGVKDGVIENPTKCHFDPKTIQCKGDDGPSCLTEGQIESARMMVSSVKNPRTGAMYFEPHLSQGSELMWSTVGGPEPMANIITSLKNIVFKDPNYDYHRFDPATDLDRAVKAGNGQLESSNPDLKPFIARGGKLLMYHGWNDQQISPMISMMYYDSVVKTVGQAAVAESVALFLVPGMNHCRGGAGTDTFDKMAAIEQWVEQKKKPGQIMASHVANGKVERTRPLCPYGQVAKWKGSGSTDDAANFSCVAEAMNTN